MTHGLRKSDILQREDPVFEIGETPIGGRPGGHAAAVGAPEDTTRAGSTRVGASFSSSIVSGLLATVHGLTIAGTGLAIYFGYVRRIGPTADTMQLYAMGLASVTVVIMAAFYFQGLYDFQNLKHPAAQVRKIALIVTGVFLTFLAMGFALKVAETYSRVWTFSWYLSALGLVSFETVGWYVLLRRWGHAGLVTRRIAIIGGGEQGLSLVQHLARNMSPWDRLIGIYDDRSDRLALGIRRYPVSGSVNDLIRYSRSHRVDDILIALPWSAEERILGIVHSLSVLPVQVDLAPDKIGLRFAHRRFGRVAEVPALNVFDKPITGWDYVVKWLEDRVLATLILLFALPPMLLIGIVIKLDSRGPVLFKQRRYGFNNELIEVLKFRTMRHNRGPESGVPQATKNDNRVTRVGRWLRRTSLDELPQLFNVLQGDMSVVGPRPHAVEHNEQYAAIIGDYSARHRVKPGITGWAQVNGLRGETDTAEKMKARVEFDVHYIENWTPLLDFRILVRTAFVVFSRQNAY